MTRVALAVILSLPLAQPAYPQRVVSRTPSSAVFAFDQDTVWRALIEALMKANIQPQTMDKASGSVIFRTEAQWTSYWGGVNAAVGTMTTKQVKSNSTWQALIVSGNVFCKPKGAGQTEVTVTLQFAGYNGFAQWLAGSGWQSLVSSGWLERQILDGIESRLPSEIVLPEKPGDPAAAQSAEETIAALRRVDAAYKISADDTTIMQYLIDAQAKFDGFAEGLHGKAMPKTQVALSEALDSYKKARSEKDARESLLTLARGAIMRGSDNVAAFKKWSVEVGPSSAQSPAKPVNVPSPSTISSESRPTEDEEDPELDRQLDPVTVMQVDAERPAFGANRGSVVVSISVSTRWTPLRVFVDGKMIYKRRMLDLGESAVFMPDKNLVLRTHFLSFLTVKIGDRVIEIPQGKKQMEITVR